MDGDESDTNPPLLATCEVGLLELRLLTLFADEREPPELPLCEAPELDLPLELPELLDPLEWPPEELPEEELPEEPLDALAELELPELDPPAADARCAKTVAGTNRIAAITRPENRIMRLPTG